METGVRQTRAAVKVRVTLRNVSERAGKEVVQVYVRALPVDGSEHPIKLAGFATVKLQPGESQKADIELGLSAFARWSEASKAWEVKDGEYEVLVGRSAREIFFRARLTRRPAGATRHERRRPAPAN